MSLLLLLFFLLLLTLPLLLPLQYFRFRVRWLRQPLVDVKEINRRLDVVEVMHLHPSFRNKLRDGPLKSLPDLDTVLSKMTKRTAGLGDLYRLYLFSQGIPSLVAVLKDLCAFHAAEDTSSSSSFSSSSSRSGCDVLREWFVDPLERIAAKFALFEQLVEHVLDMDQLPDYKVAPRHDPQLHELAQEQADLEAQAEALLASARKDWAAAADARMERNTSSSLNSTLPSFLLRTTKADERQLKASYAAVEIVSILKNGVYFTFPALKSVSSRFAVLQEEYRLLQQELVEKAVDTARTYVPLLECVAQHIAELDVLVAFAAAAALSPGQYVRPSLLEKGSGKWLLEKARHPCVELMEGVDFIANDYDLERGQSDFQIVTGPNMGGKSTFIRAAGAIAVLAQVGMFVPCERATLSVLDSILARVGAGDAVQKGHFSPFRLRILFIDLCVFGYHLFQESPHLWRR